MSTDPPLSRAGSLPQGGAVEMANARKHKGEPKLPFNLLLRALFLLLRGGLLLFLATVALYRCYCRSPFGIKSKRIFLSADLLFR
jgi:hypothetical protein